MPFRLRPGDQPRSQNRDRHPARTRTADAPEPDPSLSRSRAWPSTRCQDSSEFSLTPRAFARHRPSGALLRPKGRAPAHASWAGS